jgi:hypothetical protein
MSTCSFPRDWTYSEGGTSIVVPAVTGVSHALTAINVTMYTNLTIGALVLVQAAGVTVFQPGIVLASTAGSDFQAITASWSGTKATPPGQSLTVEVVDSGAAEIFMDIAGYDL